MHLETLEANLFRSTALFEEPRGHGLYGGQVAAQALLAAARTVDDDRQPHSLHSYFLSRGESNQPVVFAVERDRDGRSYSARRVVARQDGRTILSLAASFHAGEQSPDVQADDRPDAPAPEQVLDRSLVSRCVGIDFLDLSPETPWPRRMWTRLAEQMPLDGCMPACLLTYLSDIYSGLFTFPEARAETNLISLDHSVWFHRDPRVDDWLLMDLCGESIANGRGMYRGSIFDRSGRLLASLAQESLFRQTDRARRTLRVDSPT